MELAFSIVCFIAGISFGFARKSISKQKKLEKEISDLKQNVAGLISKNSLLTNDRDHAKKSLSDSVNKRIEAEKLIVNLEADIKKVNEESQELKEEINRMAIEYNKLRKELDSKPRSQRKKNNVLLNK